MTKLFYYYIAFLGLPKQWSTSSSIFAVPTHITLSAPPQYILTLPSSSGTAPQENTTL